jgi:predicted RNase H-like HicB family nuclease
MKYTVILEQGESSYGAFVPDLPGCIATTDH